MIKHKRLSGYNISQTWSAGETAAQKNCCKRIWLITTNDDINAIRFYQKKGFDLKAAHINAIEHSRKLKPTIPLIGMHNIPIKHELEFEILLEQNRES